MNAEQFKAILGKLSDAALLFVSPNKLGAIKALLAAGTELNTLIQAIKKDTEENNPELWEMVRQDFSGAVDAWEKSKQ